MKMIIPFMLASLIILSASAMGFLTPFVYQLELSYSKGAVAIENMTLTNAPVDAAQPEEGYEIRLFSSDNKVISTQRFVFPDEISVTPPAECFDNGTGDFSDEKCPDFSAHKELEYAGTIVNVPYEERAVKLAVFSPEGKKLAERDITSLADYCGDGKCGDREYPFTCQEDCKSGVRDGLCDGVRDGLCDPDCGGDWRADPDCEASLATGSFVGTLTFIIPALIIAVAAVAALFFIRKRGGGQKAGYYRQL